MGKNSGKNLQKTQAERLRALHSEIIGSCRMILSKAIEAGEILNDVKASLPHGEFTSWVERNAGFNIRTAQRYMKIYGNREQINDSVSLLTDAHRLLTMSKVEALPQPVDKEVALNRLEEVIELGIKELGELGLKFDDILIYLGCTLDEFLNAIPLLTDETFEKLRPNIREIIAKMGELYSREGWRALGYNSFDECIKAEFKMKKGG